MQGSKLTTSYSIPESALKVWIKMFKHTAKHFALSMIMPHRSLFATSPFVHSFSLPVFVLVIIYKGNLMLDVLDALLHSYKPTDFCLLAR